MRLGFTGKATDYGMAKPVRVSSSFGFSITPSICQATRSLSRDKPSRRRGLPSIYSGIPLFSRGKPSPRLGVTTSCRGSGTFSRGTPIFWGELV